MSEGSGDAGSLRRRPAAEPVAAVFDSPKHAPPVQRGAGKSRRLPWLLAVVLLGALVLALSALQLGRKEKAVAEEPPPKEELLEEEVFTSACGLAVNASLVRRVFERAGKKCVEPLRTWVCSLAVDDFPRVAAPQAGAGQGCGGPPGAWAPTLQYQPVKDPYIRVGIVLLVHKWWRNALRSLSRFNMLELILGQDKLSFSAVVHVDARADEAFRELSNYAVNRTSVEVFRAYDITRGGEAMLLASLDGIKRLVHGPLGPPDFTMLLSESHYVMRTAGQFHAMLALHAPLSFVGIHRWFSRGGSLAAFKSEKEGPAIEYEEKRRIPMFECGGKVFVDESIPVPAALSSEPYVGGVQWVTLSRQVASAAFLRDKDGGPEYLATAILKQVRLFAQPDEAFFQTLLAAMKARDECDAMQHQIIGYSLTWSEAAAYSGPDPNSEVEVTSPPLLDHFNEQPNLEDQLYQPWSTPSLFLRKLDNNVTRPFQDRLDFILPTSMLQNVPFDTDDILLPMCAMLEGKNVSVKSGKPECWAERLNSHLATSPYMRFGRLMLRLAVKLDEKVRSPAPVMVAVQPYVLPTYVNKEASFFVTERWALRSPEEPAQPGLRVLSLRVGRKAQAVTFHRFAAEAAPVLAPASVVWQTPGELGLLAYLEVLPMSLHFEVEWEAPNKTIVRHKTTAHKHAWSLWSPCPLQQSLQEGRWRVALHLSSESPGGPRLLAWRDFLVAGKPRLSDLEEYFMLSHSKPVM